MLHDLKDFIITFPDDMTHETYSFKDMAGIILKVGKVTYDVVANIHLGNRLIINGPHEAEWRDIPFHRGTDSFLPEGVSVQWR